MEIPRTCPGMFYRSPLHRRAGRRPAGRPRHARRCWDRWTPPSPRKATLPLSEAACAGVGATASGSTKEGAGRVRARSGGRPRGAGGGSGVIVSSSSTRAAQFRATRDELLVRPARSSPAPPDRSLGPGTPRGTRSRVSAGVHPPRRSKSRSATVPTRRATDRSTSRRLAASPPRTSTSRTTGHLRPGAWHRSTHRVQRPVRRGQVMIPLTPIRSTPWAPRLSISPVRRR